MGHHRIGEQRYGSRTGRPDRSPRRRRRASSTSSPTSPRAREGIAISSASSVKSALEPQARSRAKRGCTPSASDTSATQAPIRRCARRAPPGASAREACSRRDPALCLAEPRLVRQLGQAEIGDLHLALAVDEHVVGLDVQDAAPDYREPTSIVVGHDSNTQVTTSSGSGPRSRRMSSVSVMPSIYSMMR